MHERRRVLAIASSGGHWSQLMLLREALTGHDVFYATTLAGLAEQHQLTAHLIPDCNRNTKSDLFRAIPAIWRVLRAVRPDVVISTGALPGLIGLCLARLAGKRTIWVESIANADDLSMSGRIARRIADQCFVQWPDLAERVGARYAGAVL